MSSGLFHTGKPHETIGWERLPLLVRPARRRLGRSAWFTFGVIAGLLIEALAR